MPTNNKNIIPVENGSWTTVNIPEKENYKVIRKFINPAIYVEKEVLDLAPSRKTSPLTLHDDMENADNKNDNKDHNHLQISSIHCNNNDVKPLDQEQSSTFQSGTEEHLITYGKTNDELSTCSSEKTEITIIAANHNSMQSQELHLSSSTLNTNRTNRTSSLDPKEKEKNIQNWIARKDWEKQRKIIKEAKLVKQHEAERLKLIEQERENFKLWLAKKKAVDDRKKADKEIMKEKEKLRQAEKEKKQVENQIMYYLWLRKKRQVELETKIKEKMEISRIYKEKQKRYEENEKAYQLWLKQSKYKPKPIPMNRGIESLCSSVSVGYINPLPWTPNISVNEAN